MADLAQIEQALRAADAAGNKEDARRLAQAYADARSQQAAPPQAQAQQSGQAKPSGFVDAVRSIPGGIAKGVAGLVGLPGDLESLNDNVAAWISEKTGYDPQKIAEFREQSARTALPGTKEVNKAISDPFGGYYEPQTKAGHYAETIASFAPNALLPGSMAERAARVVVPGAASEAAGQATKGSKWEPLARAGGALAGGIGTGLVEWWLAKNPVPSLDELKQMKNAAYKQADQAGVVISPQAWSKFAGDVDTTLNQAGLTHPELHKNALSALQTIQKEAASGQPISLSRADIIRQVVNDAVDSASNPNGNGGDLKRSMQVKGLLDDFLDNLTPQDTLSGNASVAVPILKDARALAQREFKGREIQKLIDLAENQASSNYSASGEEQALRVQFKNLNAKLIKDQALAKSFSDAEREAITRVAKGGPIGNALRYLGKLAPSGVVSGGAGIGLGAYAGGMMGGPAGAAIGSAAVPAFGYAARQGATAITKNNADMAAALMRAGQPLPPMVDSKNALLAAILSQATAQPNAQ